MLHHYRAQTLPLGRPTRIAPPPSPETISLMAQGDVSGGVPHPYHQAGQQLMGFVSRPPVSGEIQCGDLVWGEGLHSSSMVEVGQAQKLAGSYHLVNVGCR